MGCAADDRPAERTIMKYNSPETDPGSEKSLRAHMLFAAATSRMDDNLFSAPDAFPEWMDGRICVVVLEGDPDDMPAHVLAMTSEEKCPAPLYPDTDDVTVRTLSVDTLADLYHALYELRWAPEHRDTEWSTDSGPVPLFDEYHPAGVVGHIFMDTDALAATL